jgi:hypothetical protein
MHRDRRGSSPRVLQEARSRDRGVEPDCRPWARGGYGRDTPATSLVPWTAAEVVALPRFSARCHGWEMCTKWGRVVIPCAWPLLHQGPRQRYCRQIRNGTRPRQGPSDVVFGQLPIFCRVGDGGKHRPGHTSGAGGNTVVTEGGQHRVHIGAVVKALSSCDVLARAFFRLYRAAPDRAVSDQDRAGCAPAGVAIRFRSHDAQGPQQSGQALRLAVDLDPQRATVDRKLQPREHRCLACGVLLEG